eukprot:TRINITY_DN17077_c0_g1_i1.p1 TRINITY_DN17077_c0_g1~~TRINITY_DN17077_c0_g1_i1.p1  ORF type:complete len:288 (+),score=45.46 TRINITY_DN17077_c0_g1_i1:145-1008(+)
MSFNTLEVLNVSFGWIYFVAWSLSFYPQVVLNWYRKSVIGYSLDYATYNILGFSCYAIFNVALYYVGSIQNEYLAKNGPPIPVQLNDVFFAVHAVILMAVICIQCIIYDRGTQRVSSLCIILTTGSIVSIYGVSVAATFGLIDWLSVLYFLSYVKMGVTLVKYIPQAWTNYTRKSTVGWNIHNVLLDLTGGTFSFAQMFVNVLQSGNWDVFIGNPTKLGLSLISIVFDILFMFQHYVLYTDRSDPALGDKYEKQVDDDDVERTERDLVVNADTTTYHRGVGSSGGIV